MSEPRPAWHWLAGLALAAGLFGAGIWLGREKPPKHELAPVATTAAPAPVAPAPAPQDKPLYPIAPGATPDEATDAAALPMLEESDAAVVESLVGLLGLDSLVDLLYPEHLVQRVVVTIDNLPRKKIGQLSPVKPVAGAFAVSGADDARALDPGNYARYAPYVRALEAIDAHKLVGWYRGFYPLFQQAYRELGYPDRYFNDRLVEVIDHLLAAPTAPGAIALTKPEAFYRFADPALEDLSAGHKLLLRIGPENAAKVKAKLRELRREVTGESGSR